MANKNWLGYALMGAGGGITGQDFLGAYAQQQSQEARGKLQRQKMEAQKRQFQQQMRLQQKKFEYEQKRQQQKQKLLEQGAKEDLQMFIAKNNMMEVDPQGFRSMSSEARAQLGISQMAPSQIGEKSYVRMPTPQERIKAETAGLRLDKLGLDIQGKKLSNKKLQKQLESDLAGLPVGMRQEIRAIAYNLERGKMVSSSYFGRPMVTEVKTREEATEAITAKGHDPNLPIYQELLKKFDDGKTQQIDDNIYNTMGYDW